MAKFVDEVEIEVKSGKGGDGCVSFRRERYRPFGGPDGGDGGAGGSIILSAEEQLSTLLDFRYNRIYKAKNGQPGMGNDRYGAAAKDVIIRVPVGTLIYDAENNALLADLNRQGKRIVVAQGGRGGRGNMHFKNSTNQAPRQAELGQPAQERRLRLELKLLADVGVVGYPNTGKSTLISRLSRAKPKIADYPFTTLVPTLGVIPAGNQDSFVMADVPGLIEGAADGHGLGHRFLKHVERCHVLVHLTTWLPGDPLEASILLQRLEMLNEEMSKYSIDLANKPKIIAISKVDIPEVHNLVEEVQEQLSQQNDSLQVLAISAVSGEGLPNLVGSIYKLLQQTKKEEDIA